MAPIKQEVLDKYAKGIFKSHKHVKSYLKHVFPNTDFSLVGTSGGYVTCVIIKDGKLTEKVVEFYWSSGENLRQYTELYNFILTSD